MKTKIGEMGKKTHSTESQQHVMMYKTYCLSVSSRLYLHLLIDLG